MTKEDRAISVQGVKLVREGKRLIEWIAFARVPMPKTTEKYFQGCAAFMNAVEAARAALENGSLDTDEALRNALEIMISESELL